MNRFLLVCLCFCLTSCSSFGFDSPDMSMSKFFRIFGIKQSPKNISEFDKADRILVLKEERWLKLLDSNGEVIRSYKIALGANPVGKKRFEGDNKTPEGIYHVANKNPYSRYHLSLLVSYPNKKDRKYAKKYGKSPGGEIMIHGLENKSGLKGYFKHLMNDNWTAGCIAVDDKEMDEIWRLVDTGTKIEIRP